MKKIYLMLLSFFSLTIAYGQPGFLNATISEIPYPIPNSLCERATELNCYSYGDVYYSSGNLQNLFVYSWEDPTTTGQFNTSHIGWKRVSSTTGITQDEGNIMIPNSRGMDVAILELNGNIYVIAGYYKFGVGHVLDYYRWDLTTLTWTFSFNLSSSMVYTPVHLDAHKLYGYALTWEVGGKIHVSVGRTDSGPLLACDIILQQYGAYHNPDIAIGHPNNSNDLSLHLVYTSSNNDQVKEAKLGFADAQLNCQPTKIPQIQDLMYGSDFGVPRIDCPDNFDTDDWSYIVSDNNKINSSIMAYSNSSTPTHYVVNDGSLGNTDITNTINLFPVLAYDNIGKSIYYCWYSSIAGYIGVKSDINGNLLNSDYWKMLVNPSTTSPMPSIALSGQNDHSNDLYSVFTILNSTINYEINYKNIPWSQSSFRPRATNISNVEMNSSIKVNPNPFEKGIQIRNSNDKINELIYDVKIIDIAGNELFYEQGNLTKINNDLSTLGNDLKTGLYFLKLKQGFLEKSFKIIRK